MHVSALLLRWGSYCWDGNLLLLIIYFSSLLCQWQPTPVLLPGKSHGRRSLVGYSPWGRWELDRTEQLHFHFSLFHWRKWQPTPVFCLYNPRDGGAWWAAIYGSHRVGHDWSDLACCPLCLQGSPQTWQWECFLVFGNFFLFKTPFPGQSSVPTSFVSFFVFYIFSYLFSKTMSCFSGCLISSAGIQKLFCGIYSALKCSFDEFVGEKVVSLSYSSAILSICDLSRFILCIH